MSNSDALEDPRSDVNESAGPKMDDRSILQPCMCPSWGHSRARRA